MSLNNRNFHLREVILMAVTLVAIFFLQHFFKIQGLSFKSFTESDVLSIVTSMFVVAVFMERSVEAILTPVRAPDAKKIEQEIREIKAALDKNPNRKKDLMAKQVELENYSLVTARRAYWLSFIFGLLISLVGVRVLFGLVDGTDSLTGIQNNMFSFVDILLTGGVISGGSAAIDKIGRSISKYYNMKSVTDTQADPDANS